MEKASRQGSLGKLLRGSQAGSEGAMDTSGVVGDESSRTCSAQTHYFFTPDWGCPKLGTLSSWSFQRLSVFREPYIKYSEQALLIFPLFNILHVFKFH